MNMQSARLGRAARFAVTGFFAACSAAMPLAAQQADELEEIVVTGSFISRPADRPQPITVIDNAELTSQNKGSIAEIFKELPQVSGTVSTINWSEGQDSATNTVNLRGLGARATLVLLNSKRQTVDGSSNSQGISAVDINNLAPPIMIERIEVLTDGASALYGSDAVAGVVNFITRNDFDGAELRLNGLWNADATSGTPEFNVSGLFGTQGANTGIVAGFEYASTEQGEQRRPLRHGAAERWLRFSLRQSGQLSARQSDGFPGRKTLSRPALRRPVHRRERWRRGTRFRAGPAVPHGPGLRAQPRS